MDKEQLTNGEDQQETPAFARKIEIGITESREVGINIVGEFKTYEFYGILLTTLIDVFGSNLINDFVKKVAPSPLAKKEPTQEEVAAKQQKLERMRKELLDIANS